MMYPMALSITPVSSRMVDLDETRRSSASELLLSRFCGNRTDL